MKINEQMAEFGIASLRSDVGLAKLRVVSNSMSPMLLEGDILIVSSPQIGSLRRGDLVVIKVKQDLFTHRLIKKSDQYCQTKGDRWHYPDPLIRTSDIIGIVQSRERRGRNINFLIPRWRRLNAILGFLGYMQVGWLKMLKSIKHAQQTTTREETELPLSTWLSWPFRMIERILIVIWGYK